MFDSDVEEEDTPKWKGIAGTIFVINAYDPSKTGSPNVALNSVKQTVRLNMRIADSNVVGVCLCGTKNQVSNSLSLQTVIEVLNLGVPTLDSFKKLQEFNDSSFEQGTELKLSEVFWQCSRMFTNCKKLLSDRTVVMLSRLDVPPVAQDRRPTLKRIVDLVNLGIELKIVNISKDNYPIHDFYLELLRAAQKNTSEVSIPIPMWDSKEIIPMLQQRSHRHLASSRIKFEIGNGFEISVGIYNLVKPKPMPKTVKLVTETNEIVTSNIKLTKATTDPTSSAEIDDIENGSNAQNLEKEVPLLKSEILYYQVYGNEKIEFTPEEMKQLKNPFGNPRIKLLGFKPKEILKKEQWFLRNCALLFPIESIIEGSTKVFKALHKACTDMSVIAICMLCSRVNSKPKLVGLSPCVNPLNLKIDAGFDIIYIPYLENVKDIPDIQQDDIVIGAQAKGFIKNLMRELFIDFKSDTFENPKLQYLYRGIEALALQEESTEPYADTTKPSASKFEHIDKEMFENIFGKFSPLIPKRPTSNTSDGPPAKRSAETFDLDKELLDSRLQIKQINKYNINDLKKILRWKNPPDLPALTGKKKYELVELVYKCFE